MALATQTINLDLRPHYNKQNTNIVYCSQYDSDLRNVVVNIADAGTAVNVSTYTIYIEGTKPDKKGFSYELTDIGGTVSNNVVTFPLQLQMTACAGITNAELVFYSGDDRVGSSNFILAVEKAGLADDIDVSETDIPAYVDGAQQAAQAAEDAKDAAVDAKDTAVAVAASIPADYTTLSNDVDDLKSAFDQITEINNLFVKADATIGSRLDTSGYPFTDANSFLSAYIPVELGKTYYKNSPTLDAYHRMATYNENHEKLRVINDDNSVTIEGSEVYVRFCGLLTEIDTATFATAPSAIDTIARQKIEDINEIVPASYTAMKRAEEFGYAFNLSRPELWEQGKLVIVSSQWVESYSNVRIRTKDYIQTLLPNVDIVKAPEGYLIIGCYYKADGSYYTVGQWTDTISGILSEEHNLRIVAKKDPEETITPVDAVNIGMLRYDISHVDNVSHIESYIDTLCKSRSGNEFNAIKADFDKKVQKYIDTYGSTVGGVTKTFDEMREWLLNRNNCIYRGALHKNGINIVDENNNPVVLNGIGTHYLLDYDGLHTYDSIETLKYYGINCLRITAYTADHNMRLSGGNDGLAWKFCYGYITKKEETKAVIESLVDICSNLGMYCIIDWHILAGQQAANIATEMNEFFTYFSTKYANNPHVIYELLNEPFANTAAELATTMKNAYDIIRANNPTAVIVTGIGSDESSAMVNVLNSNGMSDVFVSRHFYQTGTGGDLSYLVQEEYDANFPMFYTEWGNSDANGAGEYFDTYSQALMDKMHSLNRSNCCWKFTYQNMTTAVLNWSLLAQDGNGYKYGGFNDVELSHNGKFYFGNYQSYMFEE